MEDAESDAAPAQGDDAAAEAAMPATVADRLRHSDHLTRAERRLAEAMLSNYPATALGSITALARNGGVSAPTVVRLARKLGYSGFPDLQRGLHEEIETTYSTPLAKQERWVAEAPQSHIVNRFAEAAARNMRRTLARLDTATFDAVVDLLADPERKLFVAGGRITHALADYLFTHLQVIRSGVILVGPHTGTWPHAVLDMRRGDVLVAFDIRRYEREMLRLAESTAERGAVVVLLTDPWRSPAAGCATHVLTGQVEAPSAWDSCGTLMFLVESAIAAVQAATWDESRARLEEAEGLLDRSRLFGSVSGRTRG